MGAREEGGLSALQCNLIAHMPRLHAHFAEILALGERSGCGWRSLLRLQPALCSLIPDIVGCLQWEQEEVRLVSPAMRSHCTHAKSPRSLLRDISPRVGHLQMGFAIAVAPSSPILFSAMGEREDGGLSVLRCNPIAHMPKLHAHCLAIFF